MTPGQQDNDANSTTAMHQKEMVHNFSPCCDNPPHVGPCDPKSHRYRQLPRMRPATDVEIRVAATEGQGGLIQLIKRQMEADLDEELKVQA